MLKRKKKKLKSGDQTTEYKNTNKLIWIGVALLFADKLAILGIDTQWVKDLAGLMKDNTNELVGGLLVFGSSMSYRLERVFLKYQELKHTALNMEDDEDDEEEVEV
jgi:hypothetical protein